MRINLERMVYPGESKVLTTFHKTREVDLNISLMEFIEDNIKSYLNETTAMKDDGPWVICSIVNCQIRCIAIITGKETKYFDDEAESIGDLISWDREFTVVCVHGLPTKSISKNESRLKAMMGKSYEVPTPFCLNSNFRYRLACICMVMALAILSFIIYRFAVKRDFLIELMIPFITLIIAGSTLMQGFSSFHFYPSRILFRCKYGKEETYFPQDFDHMEWINGGRILRFVLKLEKEQRTYLEIKDSYTLEPLVWGLSNEVPLYTRTKE